jgi:hypothetical protein
VARFTPFEVRPLQPMLVQPFHHPGWVYEEKVDGWRMVAYKAGGTVRLVSRKGVDHASPRHRLRHPLRPWPGSPRTPLGGALVQSLSVSSKVLPPSCRVAGWRAMVNKLGKRCRHVVSRATWGKTRPRPIWSVGQHAHGSKRRCDGRGASCSQTRSLPISVIHCSLSATSSGNAVPRDGTRSSHLRLPLRGWRPPDSSLAVAREGP